MFNSAISILENYVDGITPYNFYAIEMERGENTEDLYYLCSTDNMRYIVFETDWVSPKPYPSHEATEIFASYGAKPIHWLVKKDKVVKVGGRVLPLDVPLGDKTQQYYEALVSDLPNSYLKHAVLEVKS